VDAASALREQLLSDATALARRGLIAEQALGSLKGPIGHRNLAFDLSALSSVLRESWSKLEGKTAIVPSELEQARFFADQLLTAVGLREQGVSDRGGDGGFGGGGRRGMGEVARVDRSPVVYNTVYMAEMVRIDPASHATLSEVARAEGLSLTQALARAVELYRRQVFLAGVVSDFAKLRRDRTAWSDEVAERASWEGTVADGLEREPPHPDAQARVAKKRARAKKRRT
jgi:hypothetical protein